VNVKERGFEAENDERVTIICLGEIVIMQKGESVDKLMMRKLMDFVFREFRKGV